MTLTVTGFTFIEPAGRLYPELSDPSSSMVTFGFVLFVPAPMRVLLWNETRSVPNDFSRSSAYLVLLDAFCVLTNVPYLDLLT